MTDELEIRLSLTGQPPRKSNGRRIVTSRRTGKPMVIKSEGALDWLEDVSTQIPAWARVRAGSPDRPLAITFLVRYASRRPDLSVELILDMLQKERVIRDDRYVFETHAFKSIDPENPGVDILITDAQHTGGWKRWTFRAFFLRLAERVWRLDGLGDS